VGRWGEGWVSCPPTDLPGQPSNPREVEGGGVSPGSYDRSLTAGHSCCLLQPAGRRGDAGCKGGTPLYGEKGLLTSRDNSELMGINRKLMEVNRKWME
jgi:hypothetical protein